MKSLRRTIFTAFLSLALLGFSEAAMANNNQPAGNKGNNGNNKNCKVWCPKVKLVCKPCKNGHKPPSSTCNPKDVCCSFVIVGWYDCTPKHGKCNGPHDEYKFWDKDNDGKGSFDNDRDRDEKGGFGNDKDRDDRNAPNNDKDRDNKDSSGNDKDKNDKR